MQLPDGSKARSWEGQDVVDSDGQPLGRCTGVFADTATGVAEWLDVDVEGHGRSFVPAVGATAEEQGPVRVPFSREAVLAAPAVGDEVQLSKAEEIELYRHYGVPVEATEEGSVLPSDAADAPVADAADAADAPVATATVPPAITPTAAPPAVTPAEAPAAPRLRRVEPVPPAAPSSGTTPAGTSSAGTYGGSSSSGSAAAPLGAVAGVVALVALGLRARDARQRRRTSPAARADRLRRSVKAGSTSALASAGATLAAVPDATASTRRAASDAAVVAAREAARRRKEAAKAAEKSRKQARTSLAAAGRAASASTSHSAASLRATSRDVARTAAAQRDTAAKAAAAQRKAAAKAAAAQRKAAAKAAAAQRKQAAAALAAATKAASAQRKAATASLSSVSRPSASRRGRSATSSVTAVPTRVARRGRKVRRSIARKVWDAVLLSAAGGGYVLGAKAGRERYEELGQVASAVAGSPKVQSATAALTDPERRSDLLLEVQQQASALVGRRGQRRS